jgi:myo-inositol 2-dehydrogenase/D-chiro-inositol 1-dehydrogenase
MPSAVFRSRTLPILKKHLVQIFNCDGVLQECVGGFLERFVAAYLAELHEFGGWIREDRKLDVRAEDGTATTRIAFALTESYRERRIVKV